jgi:hypothetical protein
MARNQHTMEFPSGIEAVSSAVRQMSDTQALAFARQWTDSRFAARARAQVMHPDTAQVADLLADLDRLEATMPLPHGTIARTRAVAVTRDAPLAAYGQRGLSSAKYLTLILPAWRGWADAA